ncbi:MAG: potassium transporter Kup [Candidatus Zixiibacteriota bacterium]|nr:MAG: potassium transporter Kup [candidate division Zixibacteria bacterium]
MTPNKSEDSKIDTGVVANRINDSSKGNLTILSLAALGVVFGDIGTSPLYAVRECFHGEYGIEVSSANIFGVLSLIFWTLIIVVTVKYLTFILRADNNGEGGVIALVSLIKSGNHNKKKRRLVLVAIGLFAASLLYGDGMITPAISVLSAVEGLKVVTPFFEPYIIHITVIILTCLFLIQKRGTAGVGAIFGPVMVLWFSILAVLGITQIVRHPGILLAISPLYAIEFLLNNHLHGFLVLGAVFLVVTGAEAIYADMGHFGTRPIRLTWIALVLPALLLNYFGQGALLLWKPEEAYHPFYAMAPSWGIIPMVILATAATIIASQAVITGVFSLTRQAIQLGYLPRLRVAHTSSKHFGQIYVPPANWFLMLATVILVIGFQSSSKLAAAYGVAVTSTMLISTILFYVVARERWGWNILAAGIPTLLFLIVDISFFGANISKIFHGAWFPLFIGGFVFLLFMTWKKGREILAGQFMARTISVEKFEDTILTESPQRVQGQAIFLTGNPDVIPVGLTHNLAHNKILHSEIGILHFATQRVPRVPNDKKVTVFKAGEGLFLITARYGFMEIPNVGNVLSLARVEGVDFKIEKTSFFLGREMLVPTRGMGLISWRKNIFLFMSRNALDASTFYDIPVEQIIEVGVRLKF